MFCMHHAVIVISSNSYMQNILSFIWFPVLFSDVNILHLIPLPFPPCWHRLCDDEHKIDNSVVQHLLKIFQVFVVEYFGLAVV